jgi:two-component system chemotaxis response regulator CheY
MGRRAILFVDDSAFFRSRLRAALESPDYDVHSVSNGAEALDWIAHHPPADLVITDLHMPDLDGIGLIERLRADRSYHHVPIFVLTSGAEPEEKEQVRAAGATAWIVKPFDRDKLVTAIEKVVH